MTADAAGAFPPQPFYERWSSLLVLFSLLAVLCFGSHIWLEHVLEARGRPVGTEVGLYVDLLGGMRVEEIRDRVRRGDMRFSVLSRSALPNMDGAYFLRIPLEPWMAGRVLELAPKSAVDLRIALPDGEILQASGGGDPESKPLWAVGMVIPLPERIAGGDDLFVEARSTGPVRLALRIYPKDVHAVLELLRTFAVSVYVGVVAVVVALNLAAAFVFRERYYLGYSLFLTSMCLAVFGLSGFATLYLWGDSRLLRIAGEDLALLVAAFAAVLFTRDFLDTRRNLPVIDSWLLWLAGACAVLFIASTLILDERSVWVMLGFLGPILVVFCAFAAFVALRKGVAQARLVLLSWVPLALAVLGGTTSNLGWHAVSLASLFQAASLMEMLMLSSAIAARIALLRRERDQAVAAASRAHEALMEEQNGRLELLEQQSARHRRAAETALAHAEARRDAMVTAGRRLANVLRSGHRELQAITLRAEQWRGAESGGFELLMGDLARAADGLGETLAEEIRDTRGALGIEELSAHRLESLLRTHLERLAARGARTSLEIPGDAALIHVRAAELEACLALLADLMFILPAQPIVISARRIGQAVLVEWLSTNPDAFLRDAVDQDPALMELQAQIESAGGEIRESHRRLRIVFRAGAA